MQNNPVRVIIDTNLWVSFLITKQFYKLGPLLLSKRVVLIFSNELLSEFLSVTQRPKFVRYFSNADIIDLLTVIDTHAEFVKIKTVVEICRDPKDNFLLSLAIDSNANYLLTGDNDLLKLQSQGQAKIITITEFLDNIR